MIVLRCKQRSAEWHRAKLGIPSASGFERILTPATLKPSSQLDAYLCDLLAEWLIGVPSSERASGFMDRGTQLEPEALKWYAYEMGVDVEEVGCVLRDDSMVACSPDGLVGEDGGIEIKTPNASAHVRYMLQGVKGYTLQVQGNLWLTGRKWWDLVSYNPELPPKVVRIERNEEIIRAIDEHVSRFVLLLLAAREALKERGCVPAETLRLPASAVVDDPF